MAKKKKKTGPKEAHKTAPASPGGSAFGLDLQGWLKRAQSTEEQATAKERRKLGGNQGRVLYLGVGLSTAEVTEAVRSFEPTLPKWAEAKFNPKRGDLLSFSTEEGPLWVLSPELRSQAEGHEGLFTATPYSAARDLAGLLASGLEAQGLASLSWTFYQAASEEQLGALIGLELGAYRYRAVRPGKGRPELPAVKFAVKSDIEGPEKSLGAELGDAAQHLAGGINLARHLVNLPAGELNPKTYSDLVASLFSGSSTTSVEVWNTSRLEEEGLGLLLGVGKAAAFGPALVHLCYRGQRAPKGQKPIAFVGKGITFDSGGLDIKVGSGMRLMKKDMGGSASLVGLAYWLEKTQLPIDCDFYLALAENAVDKHSFHPGDVLKSRSGLTVEIDNTDAEGRLVLADAMDVALSAKAKDAPGLLIDLATLTGAMRVALGARISGMFSNNDELAAELLSAARTTGEPTWRMPLFGEYFSSLKSTTADLANSGGSRLGGAITAALFLQKFVKQVPWAHFDMYAWSDGGTGGCFEAGGSGQNVQLLAEFLRQRVGS